MVPAVVVSFYDAEELKAGRSLPLCSGSARPTLFFQQRVVGEERLALPNLLELKSFILLGAMASAVDLVFICATCYVLPLLRTAPGFLDPQQALLWPIWAHEASASQHPASQPGPSHCPGH